MRILYYSSRILLYITMVICGFFNLIAWWSLSFRQHLEVYGWILFAALIIGYSGMIVSMALKKHLSLFLNSFIFPLTSVVIGLTFRSQAGGDLDFSAVFIRNHLATLLICLFAGAVWAFFNLLPEQKSKRREKDYRRLTKNEQILPD